MELESSRRVETRSRPPGGDIEQDLAYWLERLRTVDDVLKQPVLSLVKLARTCVKPGGASLLPACLSNLQARGGTYQVHSLCCSTLQRLAKISRRWPWPSDEFAKPLREMAPLFEDTLVPPATPASSPDLLKPVSDRVFGPVNPLTSAETFWVLLNAGTRTAHGPAGVVATFGMLWGIYSAREAYRRFAGDNRALPATIVSKCLMPLKRLEAMMAERSRLYRAVAKTARDLREQWKVVTPNNLWRFACGLDQLAAQLDDMSKISVNREAWETAAKAINDIAESTRPADAARWVEVETILSDTIARVSQSTEEITLNSASVLEMLRNDVLGPLRDPATAKSLQSEVRARLPRESTTDYGRRIRKAAGHAYRTCCAINKRLGEVVAACRKISGTTTVDAILDELANVNDSVADLVREAVAPAVEWSRRTVRQEVAYASAGNDTDFDAADLLSAIAIAERWDQISALEVEDAIRKTLRAAREDGSWATGQPIYIQNRVLGVWPNTSDIAWLLASAVNGKPRVRVADEALMRFVDWLSRNIVRAEHRAGGAKIDVYGWPAETREGATIDLWTTAGSINALLEIRDLIEYRLWELCQQRFFVLPSSKTLDEVDPVDLGARHVQRLHHRLRKAARASRGDDWPKAQYSFVLHGPPGSSKTAVAEALGAERAWEGERRIVRITPADFTRRGETAIDAEARFIFDLLSRVRGVTVIFDEIDDLLRRRQLKGDASFLKMIVPAMLNRLQDLRDAAPRQELCFIIAMNYVDNVEPALMRPGRIDAPVAVVYPDPWSRENTLDRIIANENASARLSRELREVIVERTAGWPWTVLNRMCKELVGQKSSVGEREVEDALRKYGVDTDEAPKGYATKDRWTPVCAPLADELARFGLAFGRTPAECETKLETILTRWEDGEPIPASLAKAVAGRFRTIWADDDRRSEPEPSPRAVTAMGAEAIVARQSASFRAWMPNASGMTALLSDGRSFPMVHEGNGTWSVEAQAVGPRSLYRFEIAPEGGGDKFTANDPYARDVTADGGYSIVQEPPPGSDFDCPGWHELVIYQIEPGSFDGNIGIGSRFDHVDERKLRKLQELGVNALDLVMPAEYPKLRPEEYDPAAVRERETRYGGISELQKLIKRAHDFGMAVIVGVTSKHLLGRGIVDLRPFRAPDSGTMGMYFAHDDELGTPYGPRPNVDEERVVELMVTNARRWLVELGADGIRWEGVHFIRHKSGRIETEGELPAGCSAIRRVNAAVFSVGKTNGRRRTISIAGDAREHSEVVERRQDGGAFGAQMSPSFARALWQVMTASADEQRNVRALAEAIEKLYNSDAFSRVIYAESRDTFSRKRLAAVLHGDEKSIARRCVLAAAVVLTSPGIPLLFQGQELASEHVAVDWELREERGATVRDVQSLIRLRRSFHGTTEGLKGHNVHVEKDEQAKVLTMHRWQRGRTSSGHADLSDEVVVVFNFSGTERKSYPAVMPGRGVWTVRFTSVEAEGTQYGEIVNAEYDEEVRAFRASVDLPPFGVLILSQSPR